MWHDFPMYSEGCGSGVALWQAVSVLTKRAAYMHSAALFMTTFTWSIGLRYHRRPAPSIEPRLNCVGHRPALLARPGGTRNCGLHQIRRQWQADSKTTRSDLASIKISTWHAAHQAIPQTKLQPHLLAKDCCCVYFDEIKREPCVHMFCRLSGVQVHLRHHEARS